MADQRKRNPQRKPSGVGATTAGAKKRNGNGSATDNHNRKTDVKLSKSLSWVLRHAAPSLGLKLAPDGFVPVESVLALDHPRFRKNGWPKYTVDDVVMVVENNDKQRFRLECRDVARDGSASNDALIGKVRARVDLGNDDCNNDRGNVVKSSIDQETNPNDNCVEEVSQNNKILCIRANQGHSVKGLRSDQLLTPLTGEELSHPDLRIIHGTTRKAWEDHIRHGGLSRMKRNHIHFATGLPSSAAKKKLKHDGKNNGATPISGMRSSSEIYIYVDGRRCTDDGIPFHRSDNGVILTAGIDEKGMLPVKYFEKVVCAPSGKVLWKPDDEISLGN